MFFISDISRLQNWRALWRTTYALQSYHSLQHLSFFKFILFLNPTFPFYSNSKYTVQLRWKTKIRKWNSKVIMGKELRVFPNWFWRAVQGQGVTLMLESLYHSFLVLSLPIFFSITSCWSWEKAISRNHLFKKKKRWDGLKVTGIEWQAVYFGFWAYLELKGILPIYKNLILHILYILQWKTLVQSWSVWEDNLGRWSFCILDTLRQ